MIWKDRTHSRTSVWDSSHFASQSPPKDHFCCVTTIIQFQIPTMCVTRHAAHVLAVSLSKRRWVVHFVNDQDNFGFIPIVAVGDLLQATRISKKARMLFKVLRMFSHQSSTAGP